MSEEATQNFLSIGQSLPVILVCKLVMFVCSSSSNLLQIYSRPSYSENEGPASHLKEGSLFYLLDLCSI